MATQQMPGELDVVVVGGGVQGLLLLGALTDRGCSCALVGDGDLGSGQTLHSHGFLNTGFGMAGPELPRAAVSVVQPHLERHGVELSGRWLLIPPPDAPGLVGMPLAPLPPGFAPSLGTAISLPDRSFPKRRLVEALAQGREDRILRGHATPRRDGARVDDVAVRLASGEEVVLRAGALVVAAGCGTKRILEDLVGRTPQTDRIKHRKVHMICLRAPRGVLPATSIVAMPLGLMLAAHEEPDGVLWYVTPMELLGPSHDDVPEDGEAGIDEEMVVRGCRSLLALHPGLPEVAGLRIGCYAGYRQDIGDEPAARMCERVEGMDNVIAALPSGLIGPWLNAAAAAHLTAGLVDPSGESPPLPHGGEGVRVGRAVEDRPDFRWMSWDEWVREHPQLEGAR